MTSFDIDDVIPRKMDDLTRKAKSGVNINRFLSNFQMILILVEIVAVQFFGENCNSLSIQNDGPKLAKKCLFLPNFSILLDSKRKYIFVMSTIV